MTDRPPNRGSDDVARGDRGVPGLSEKVPAEQRRGGLFEQQAGRQPEVQGAGPISFPVVRRGKVVAQLGPVQPGKGAEVKALLQRHRLDPAFARDVTSARELLEIENRP